MSSRMLRATSGSLAIVGGATMIFSGFQTHSFFLSIIMFMEVQAEPRLSPEVMSVVALAVGILALLISLGGITVIAGGIAVIERHISVGRFLIALGGGAGFFALGVGIVYYTATSGLSDVILHAQYWVGVVLAVVARWLSSKA